MASYGSASSKSSSKGTKVGPSGSLGKSQHIKGKGCSTPVATQIPRGKLSK